MPSSNVALILCRRSLRILATAAAAMAVGLLVSNLILADSGCNQDFVSSPSHQNGTFSSPGFPRPYPVDTICRYAFQGQGEERVQIIFNDIKLNYFKESRNTSTCDDVDSLTVSVFIDGLQRDLRVYCGSMRPPMLMSNDQRMEVTLVSRSSIALQPGFQAEYRFVKDFGIKAGVKTKDLTCGFLFESAKTPNGTFTSPNFPGLYPRNTECHYLFYGKETEIIYITFAYFDVDGEPPKCAEDTQSDYVEFSNFNVMLIDRKMNRLCGNKKMDIKNGVNSDGSFFRVTFKSNALYDALGFEAFYQFRKMDDPYSPPRITRLSNSSPSIAPSYPSSAFFTFCLLTTSAYFMLDRKNSSHICKTSAV